jgi:hypothetical protein
VEKITPSHNKYLVPTRGFGPRGINARPFILREVRDLRYLRPNRGPQVTKCISLSSSGDGMPLASESFISALGHECPMT